MLPWWTMKHGFYAEMGGYRVLDKSSGQMYCFRAPQLAWLHKQKVITIPEVSIKDIDDRSVADGLAKLLACAQSTWFLFSTCARLQQHLALTTLEVELLPYVVVTWMIYLFWWNKPLQLETYTTISVQALSIPTLIWLAEATLPIRTKPLWWRPVPFELHERGWEFYWMEKPWDLKKLQVIDTNHLIPLPLRNRVECTMAESWVADWYRDAVNDAHPCEWDCWDDIVIYCTGIFIFGVPLAAWHFDFPTQAEGILWRTAALASCGVITIWVPLALCLRWLTPGNTWKELPFYVLTPICGFSRLYLIIEIFAGLRLLPRGVFETVNWSSYLPHVF